MWQTSEAAARRAKAVGKAFGHPAHLAPGAYLRLDGADTGIGMGEAVPARAGTAHDERPDPKPLPS